MPRRDKLTLQSIAGYGNLAWAFWRSARGKWDRGEVREFEIDLETNLAKLSRDILSLDIDVGTFRRFVIYDPKRRTIHAPVFRERVLHHALMRSLEPSLDRAHIADTFACRSGKGAHRAVHRAQHFVRRYPWFARIDIRRYFDSIDHQILMKLLSRRVKGDGLLLCSKIIAGYQTVSGRGLPIGALTSQHFGNAFLAPLDRVLAGSPTVRGLVRYMDDVVWWCQSRQEALETLECVKAFLAVQLNLQTKIAVVQRSVIGVPFCGVFIQPGRIRLSRRARSRYSSARQSWEGAWEAGRVSTRALQSAVSSLVGATQHADACGWRREELRRRGCIDV